MRLCKLIIVSFVISYVPLLSNAIERTILLGPKTIGKAWKDNIVLEARHFAECQPGDILTVYNDNTKPSAQAAFQDPLTWQGVDPEYSYFGINGPFRLTFTDSILYIARTRGIAIGGHDYRILYATLSDAEDYVEHIVWNGPSVTMLDDWSTYKELPAKCFTSLREGDAVRFHVSNTKENAAIKLMDFTWNVFDPSLNGAPVGGDAYTWYVTDPAALIKIQLAGQQMNTAMRVGGTGFTLDKVSIVQFTGEISEDVSNAQRAPKEYVLQPGELFHGEKSFPADWSGNLSITAAPFQKCTENDVLLISYSINQQDIENGIKPQLSFRKNRTWEELTGAADIVWYKLDGNDVVYIFDSVALDNIKTRGFILTGAGFTLKRIELISVQ